MKTLIFSTAISIAAAVPALAGNLAPAPAEPVVLAPAPVPAPAGYDWTGGYVGVQLGYGFGDVGGSDSDGILGGAHAGYNYDFGTFVVGVEADANLADLQVDGSSDTIDQIARLKVKGGFDAGRALFYATAGGAYANADIGGTSQSDFGWAAGAGMDVRVTDRITAGAEYLYHRFDDFDGTGIDVEANTIAAKVSFHF